MELRNAAASFICVYLSTLVRRIVNLVNRTVVQEHSETKGTAKKEH